jgi:hypothetical protein
MRCVACADSPLQQQAELKAGGWLIFSLSPSQNGLPSISQATSFFYQDMRRRGRQIVRVLLALGRRRRSASAKKGHFTSVDLALSGTVR